MFVNPYCVTSFAARPIGLIAGWGMFPVLVADALRNRDYRVCCVGIHGHADPSLNHRCHAFRDIGLTRLGAQIRFLRQQGVEHAVFAGKIHKTLLFQPRFLRRNLPDWRCFRTFAPHFITRSKNCSDNSLLGAAVDAFQSGGIEILKATELVPELIVSEGMVSGKALSHRQQRDVVFGWSLARQMGGLDIGQTVAVKNQAVLAVEAIEGTDACIRRAGTLCPAGGFTVVKVAKPNQDMRFDVPTIGIGTLQTLKEAGASVLAVEADKTIVVDQPQVIEFARRHAITVVALRDGQIESVLPKAA